MLNLLTNAPELAGLGAPYPGSWMKAVKYSAGP